MPNSRFSNSIETLKQMTQDILDQATKAGASACEAEVSEGFGQSVGVRKGEVETIEYNRDKGLEVTVYFGKQRGNASTSDFTPLAIRDTVQAAVTILLYGNIFYDIWFRSVYLFLLCVLIELRLFRF